MIARAQAAAMASIANIKAQTAKIHKDLESEVARVRKIQEQGFQRANALAAQANKRIETFDTKLEKDYQSLLKRSDLERAAFASHMEELFKKQAQESASLLDDISARLYTAWIGRPGDWLDTGMEVLLGLSRGYLNFWSLGGFGKFQDKYGPKEIKFNKTIAKYTELVADIVSLFTLVGPAKQGVKYLAKKFLKKTADDLARAGTSTAKQVANQTSKEIVKQTVKHSAKYFDDMARLATKNPNSTKLVLGKTFKDGVGYGKVADHFKATYFKLNEYRRLLKEIGPDAMKEINMAFLKQQLKLGKEIILSHPPTEATWAYRDEIEYLIEAGYHFVKDGWFWRAIK